MQRYLGDKATVTYAQGSNIYDDSVRQEAVGIGRPIPRGDAKQMLAEALKVAKNADVIVACLGELADMSGESSARDDRQARGAAQLRRASHRALVGERQCGGYHERVVRWF